MPRRFSLAIRTWGLAASGAAVEEAWDFPVVAKVYRNAERTTSPDCMK